MEVHSIKSSTSSSERSVIEDRRRRLEKRIKTFHKKGDIIMGVPEVDDISSDEDSGENMEEWEDEDEDEEGRQSQTVDESENGQPERITLWLPSTLGKERIDRLGLECLGLQEMELRQGQANDALAALRTELGHKALLFRTKVRQSMNTKGKTRAFKEIGKSERKIKKEVRSYMRARRALERLGADGAIMERYKVIERRDLNVSSDMVEENRIGQRSEKLAWFWRLGPQSDTGPWMEECKIL